MSTFSTITSQKLTNRFKLFLMLTIKSSINVASSILRFVSLFHVNIHQKKSLILNIFFRTSKMSLGSCIPMTYGIILSWMDKFMIVNALRFCVLRLSTWAIVNTDGVDVVIPNIKPLDIVEEKACTTRGSTMSHRFFSHEYGIF